MFDLRSNVAYISLGLYYTANIRTGAERIQDGRTILLSDTDCDHIHSFRTWRLAEGASSNGS